MLLSQFILISKGAVNQIFAIVPIPDTRIEGYEDANTENIKTALRYDREENLMGSLVPDKNPSQDPSVVQYYYTPSMEKQYLYRNLPKRVGSYSIVDAFVCLGSRFGLQPLQVYVEVCFSQMGGHRYWANVYYVADSQIPAIVIEAYKTMYTIDDAELLKRIELDRKENEALRERMATYDQKV